MPDVRRGCDELPAETAGYGAFDDKNGACSSVVNLFEERFTHIPFVRSRILMEQCGGVLTEFFRELRMSQNDE